MSHRISSRLPSWTARAAWTGLIVALVLPLAAFLADITWGRNVLLIAPHDPSVVVLNRSLWSVGEPVADIYGSPMSEPTRVLVLRGEEVLRPEEDPGLSLLSVASGSRRPLQAQTVWWAVRLVEAALGGGIAVLVALTLFMRRRERLAARPAAV